MTLTARHTLLLDAVATSATAALMFAGRNLLYPYFGLDSPFLLEVTAAAFVVYAAIVAFAARQQRVSRTAVMTIAGANAGYVAASAVLLMMAWSDLHAAGRVMIVVVAIAVEVFATLQFAAGRRLEPATS